MKQLFIAEKPNVSKAICAGFGGGFTTKNGYYEKGDIQVTWCYGHMLELFEPEDYDEKYAEWNFLDLPMSFFPYKLKVKSDVGVEKQIQLIHTLLENCDEVVNAADYDDEGQLLFDEIIRFYKINKPIKRVLINDNTPAAIAKSLANMKDNKDYEYMGYIALSRSLADQFFGINLSRAYTLKYQAVGGTSLLSVGRVQSVMLGLIVNRCLLNRSHEISYYYNVFTNVNIGNQKFKAKYQPISTDPVDEKKRLINESFAITISNNIKTKKALVVDTKTENKSVPAPLPYNLVKLQQDCSKLLKLSPDTTDKIAQKLYEEYALITYIRTDSQFLSDEQHDDVSFVLQAVSKIDSEFDNLVSNCDSKLKNRAFNSKNVSAHHGIVPTQNTANMSDLSSIEAAVYKLIAKRYILQFYPSHQYQSTKLSLVVNAHNFSVSSSVNIDLGWKNVETTDDKLEDDETSIDLSKIKKNEEGVCYDVEIKREKTKPPALYTMDTFIGDLTNVSKYVKDPRLAKVLKERDKNKKGENGGIGTPATRSKIIQRLFERDFIEEIKMGKTEKLVCTKLGEQFYKQLSDIIKYPDMTAIWFEQQKSIKTELDAVNFVKTMMNQVVIPEVERIKTSKLAMPTHNCPKCQKPMRRRKGKRGFFWGCAGWKDSKNPCNYMVADDNGKPGNQNVKKMKKQKIGRLF